MLRTWFCPSVRKVLPADLPAGGYCRASALCGERLYFQLAFRLEDTAYNQAYYSLSVESELGDLVSVRQVGLVPAGYPCYPGADDDYITKQPALLPDILRPLAVAGEVSAMKEYTNSLWFCVDLRQQLCGGEYNIRIGLEDTANGDTAQAEFCVRVAPVRLCEPDFTYTQWFYCDCIANYYKVEVFSERFWQLVEAYMVNACEHGQNMILTPVITPALDTQVGGERLTVQLVDIAFNGGEYSFGFDKLDRWVDTALRAGMKYFEMAHMFSQWGALCAPKIMADTSGGYIRIFGWETDADSEEYTRFVREFLTALCGWLKQKGIYDVSWFHVSDEPDASYIDRYKRRAELICSVVPREKIMDALSQYDFYRQGLVGRPVPASNHIEEFLENGVPGLWTYYCCGQGVDVSNRFIAMPGQRTRIIGLQFYKFNIAGFLQWGYNFWNAHLSKYVIDPYAVTDGGGVFPSGDPFTVYPGEDGPVESVRQKLFEQALYDLRACRTLEKKIGREALSSLIDGFDEMTFKNYPREESFLIETREKINEMLFD